MRISYHPTMEARSVDAVLRELAKGGVRYLVAGGLAVVAHGHVRFTKDIDLVVALDNENTRRAIAALKGLGYRPVVAALHIEDFPDPAQRRMWVEEKDAKVFSLSSEDHRLTPIDIFIEEPFLFQEAEARALGLEYAPDLLVRFVSRDDLLAMKRRAGRPQDLLDIEALERLWNR
jgi:hypothetical protein